MAEASGILNWMLAALPGLLERQAFVIPDSVRQRNTRFSNQVNACRAFIAEKLERGESDDFISRDQLMGVFENWCKVSGYRIETVRTMKQEMKRLFSAKYHRRRVELFGKDRNYGWSGVRWRPEEADKAVSFQDKSDQGERIRELEDRQVRTMGQHNKMVDTIAHRDGTIAAKNREIEKLRGRLARLERRLAVPGNTMEQSPAPLADRDKVEMADEIGRVRKTADRYVLENAKLTRKAQRLQRQLDIAAKPEINRLVPAWNMDTPDVDSADPADPAEQAEIDELLQRLEKDDDDDVADDGAEREAGTTEGQQGLPARPAAAGGGAVGQREDDQAVERDWEVARVGPGDAATTPLAAE
jgi:hypothetical protein